MKSPRAANPARGPKSQRMQLPCGIDFWLKANALIEADECPGQVTEADADAVQALFGFGAEADADAAVNA